MTHPDRTAEVLARLDHVTDPELDEPVTELGFVTAVTVDPDGGVAVEFRLPTYWCAANFAFMMADDMRREVAALPWVTGVTLRLGEHMYADTINHGVQRGHSFQDTFGDEADGDLQRLRQTFLVKAFQRRQEALLHLRTNGDEADDEALVALTMGALAGLELDAAADRLRARYVERRGVVGPWSAEAAAFVNVGGTPLAARDLAAHLRALRRVNTNAEFNGAICSGLLAARFGVDAPSADGEPTLLDFARMGPARRETSPTA